MIHPFKDWAKAAAVTCNSFLMFLVALGFIFGVIAPMLAFVFIPLAVVSLALDKSAKRENNPSANRGL